MICQWIPCQLEDQVTQNKIKAQNPCQGTELVFVWNLSTIFVILFSHFQGTPFLFLVVKHFKTRHWLPLPCFKLFDHNSLDFSIRLWFWKAENSYSADIDVQSNHNLVDFYKRKIKNLLLQKQQCVVSCSLRFYKNEIMCNSNQVAMTTCRYKGIENISLRWCVIISSCD